MKTNNLKIKFCLNLAIILCLFCYGLCIKNLKLNKANNKQLLGDEPNPEETLLFDGEYAPVEDFNEAAYFQIPSLATLDKSNIYENVAYEDYSKPTTQPSAFELLKKSLFPTLVNNAITTVNNQEAPNVSLPLDSSTANLDEAPESEDILLGEIPLEETPEVGDILLGEIPVEEAPIENEIELINAVPIKEKKPKKIIIQDKIANIPADKKPKFLNNIKRVTKEKKKEKERINKENNKKELTQEEKLKIFEAGKDKLNLH